MSRPVSKKIDIFLNVNRDNLNSFFNPHDPAPIYKKQLRHDFIAYLNETVSGYKRFTTLRYKISCAKDDKDLIDPVMHAIRRHYQAKEENRKAEFARFKKKNFKLLGMSLAIGIAFHLLIVFLEQAQQGILSTIASSLEVFSWVIAYEPIHNLIFSWNSHLKDISLLHKLSTSEMIVMDFASSAIEVPSKVRVVA